MLPKLDHSLKEIAKADRYNKKVAEDFKPANFLITNKKFTLETLANRIEGCPSLEWDHILCGSCETQLTKKPFKLSCLSNFCPDPECTKNRIRIRRFFFKDFQIRSKKLYRFVIGFKSIPKEELTNKKRLEYHKAVQKILKLIIKTYGEFYYLSVRDINISKNGLIRVHYEAATLPLKDFRKFVSILNMACEKISKKTGLELSPSLVGYRKTTAVIDYFSKRASGVFGHNKADQKKFGFSNIMHLKQYYEVFYKTKTFNSNFSFRRRKATELVCMLNSIPKKCPVCNVFTKNNIIFVSVDELRRKPPNKKTIGPTFSKICPGCYLNIQHTNDYDHKNNMCVYCSYQQSSEYKTDQIRNKIFGENK